MSRRLVILAGTAAAAAPKPVARDAKLWAAAEKARPDQLKLLEQLVSLDSGAGNAAG